MYSLILNCHKTGLKLTGGLGHLKNCVHLCKFADMNSKNIILGIESSCDDTSAAVIADGLLLSNVIASQSVHEEFGGVVPELASRAHQQNIVPVVDAALRRACISKNDLSAIAFTRGPGLLGSLLVGTSFAKGMALGLDIPLVDVNHLHGHVLSHFIKEHEDDEVPEFPYLTLLISGGNSQLISVKAADDMEILGRTIDDAAGEAFDKCAKVMGLPYPGGPHIDRLAAEGNPKAFRFAKPHIPGLDYSFSGLKTSFLYTVRDGLKESTTFIDDNLADLAASIQKAIIDTLMQKLEAAVKQTGVKAVAIGGGVSANSGVRQAVADFCAARGLRAWIPARKFTTDNAAMVAIAGQFKFQRGEFCALDSAPFARLEI
jgi:N6-L-threonylcarbamoyladenine synthase